MEWTKIVGSGLNELSGRLGRPVGQAEISALAFYDKGDLLRVDGTYYIAAGDGPLGDAVMLELTGNSVPLHEANGLAEININADNVRDYLRFFCGFVHAECGPFVIIDDDRIENGWAWEAAPPVVRGRDGQDYLCRASVLYGGAVFWAEFRVRATGHVEMLEGDPVEPVMVH